MMNDDELRHRTPESRDDEETLVRSKSDPLATRSVLPPGPDPAPASLAEGDSFGAYRILRSLGRGGMGQVYEAEHLESRPLSDAEPSGQAAPVHLPEQVRRVLERLRESRHASLAAFVEELESLELESIGIGRTRRLLPIATAWFPEAARLSQFLGRLVALGEQRGEVPEQQVEALERYVAGRFPEEVPRAPDWRGPLRTQRAALASRLLERYPDPEAIDMLAAAAGAAPLIEPIQQRGRRPLL